MLRLIICAVLLCSSGACAPRYSTGSGTPPRAYLNSGDVRAARTTSYRITTGKSWFRPLVNGLVRSHIR